MAKKLSSVLGIDIGSHSIKVAEVKASGSGASITAVGVAPTPEGAVDYSGIYNPEEVGKVLKDLLSQVGASSPNAVVSIAGQQSVLVRVLPVPKMDPGKELASHMEWEISKNIPFAETTIQSDYKVIEGGDPNAAEMEVVMAMSPQTAIDTVVECIKKSGRKPFAIDVEPLGLARSLKSSHPELASANGVCIVDIGHSTTSINIYDSGNLVLPRPVPGGGEMVTRALADARQVGISEAEQFKQTEFSIPETASAFQGFGNPFGGGDTYSAGFAVDSYVPTPDPAPVTDSFNPMDDLAIDPITGLPVEPAATAVEPEAPTYGSDPFAVADVAPVVDAVPAFVEPASSVPASVDADFQAVQGILEDLVSELQRSIDYYSGRGGNVSQILLTGGGAKLSGLAGYLSRSLNVPTTVYDPLSNMSVSAKKVGMDYVNEIRSQLSVAVGNGLHIAY